MRSDTTARPLPFVLGYVPAGCRSDADVVRLRYRMRPGDPPSMPPDPRTDGKPERSA